MTPEFDPLHVAIDGPAGSGKSSVARAVAERLGLAHVDTGAMYRALTHAALQEGLALDDGPALARRLESLQLHFECSDLVVDGRRAGDAIRTAAVDAEVSGVSAHPEVRAAMQRRQRVASWEHTGGVVMEGRDIGTRVLPLARAKVYLDASVRERARRRALQTGRGDDPAVLEQVVAELAERDRRDSGREESPLRIPPDAAVIDTTGLDFEQVVERVCAHAEACRPERVPRARLKPFRYRQITYRITQAMIRAAVKIPYRMRIFGAPHQEIESPLIVTCNHNSYWDPIVLGSQIDRQVSFIAKRELFKGLLGAFLRFYGVIPIVRGRFDAEAFAIAEAILGAGGNVMIFPEGTRKPPGRPGPVKRGLGLLSMTTGAPYLPCLVRGTTEHARALRGRGGGFEVWVGPPTRLRALDALRAQGLDDSQIQARVGDLYLAQIKALLHRAERFAG